MTVFLLCPRSLSASCVESLKSKMVMHSAKPRTGMQSVKQEKQQTRAEGTQGGGHQLWPKSNQTHPTKMELVQLNSTALPLQRAKHCIGHTGQKYASSSHVWRSWGDIAGGCGGRVHLQWSGASHLTDSAHLGSVCWGYLSTCSHFHSLSLCCRTPSTPRQRPAWSVLHSIFGHVGIRLMDWF